jgi:hypothetical protein
MTVTLHRELDPFRLDEPLIAALTADGGPMTPPGEWFRPPDMIRPTPITVLPSGQLYGHLAAWNTPHTGLPGNVKPPKSRSNYAYFRTGVVATADGQDQPVGQLTLAGGHAPLSADASRAVQHYDDTRSAVADVNVGEDRHGIWVAGAVRPDVTAAQLRALRASAPSGDWRVINGGLELIAVCQVNAPGFPIPRAECLVASGAVTALVAAGAQDMFMRRMADVLLPDHIVAAVDARVAHHLRKQELRARVARR